MTTYASLDAALKALYGKETTAESRSRLSDGDINEAFCLTLSGGQNVFCKRNRKENLSFFTTEAAGLNAIASTKSIRTPEVLALGTDDCEGGFAFLLLSHIAPAKERADYWETFGHELAAMHLADASPYTGGARFGFMQDNYIGAGAQKNDGRETWVDFFRDCRLRPQFERASRYLDATDKQRAERLLERLDAYLVEPDAPSLLHGDLWGGNFMTGADGKAWLIDPAAYVGHAEADVAMTELFGGFHRRFYQAYREAAPLADGYEDRRDLYNLYHLLNHLNLFGGGYLGGVLRILRHYAP